MEKLCAMATSSEIGNGWQTPRISFTLDLDLSHTDTEKTVMAYSDGGNDWQSPRISFSFNLSPTDRFLLEKRKREDVADVNYDTDFEFCVESNNCNGWNSTSAETLLAVADELFADGKILPQIRGPVTIARHLSLEISRSQSTVSSTSYRPSNITGSCSGNVASKSWCHKFYSKWKEMMLKLSNRENAFAESRGTTSKVIDQDRSVNNVKQQFSSWRYLCCPLSFVRSPFNAGRKHKEATFTAGYKRESTRPRCTSTEKEALPALVQGSKPMEASSVCSYVQLDPRYLGELNPGLQGVETKAKETDGRSIGSPGQGMDSHLITRRVVGNRRSMVRNLERSSTSLAKAARLDSPPPRKPMAEGSLVLDARKDGGVRLIPVQNVGACVGIGIGIGHVGGSSWSGVADLFGFFFKRGKKQPSAYHHT